MTDSADLPLDDGDQVILDRLAAVHALLDPPPADLDERVSFAIALDALDAEVARLSEQQMVGSGARGSERTHTITFDADSRAVMITVVGRPCGQLIGSSVVASELSSWRADSGVIPSPKRTALWHASRAAVSRSRRSGVRSPSRSVRSSSRTRATRPSGISAGAARIRMVCGPKRSPSNPSVCSHASCSSNAAIWPGVRLRLS